MSRFPSHPLSFAVATQTALSRLRDISSIVVNTIDGYYFLSPATGFYKPCEPIEAGLQIDGSMVLITGETKATCDKPDDRFKVEKLQYSINAEPVVDSLFRGPPYSIKIIRSEDYGYSAGYGYRISHSSGFKVIQPIIPAIGGLKPFRTRAEAFKVAILVAYKLHEEIGLPFVTIEDLDFLEITY